MILTCHNMVDLALHAANHPKTWRDVRVVEVAEVFSAVRAEILWCSPDCKHFSRTSGPGGSLSTGGRRG